MKVMGVSEPDLDRRGAPSACEAGGNHLINIRLPSSLGPREAPGPSSPLAKTEVRLFKRSQQCFSL